MKVRSWPVAVCIVVLAAVLAASPVQTAALSSTSDPVRAWNGLALKTARVKGLSDAKAARLYAMVNVAIYDAVNGIVSQLGDQKGRGYALVSPTGAPPQGDLSGAASAAAHAVLAGEFPDLAAGFPDSSPGYDAQLESDLAAVGAVGRRSSGEAWGADVGAQVRALRTGDSPTVSQAALPSLIAGQFQAAWSGVNLAPFAIANPSDYVGSGPPALDSLDYAAAFAEVKLIGNAGIPAPDKLATFRYWSLGGGTSQPPGAWIQIALAVTDDSLPLPEMARLSALLSMAMADTVGPTTITKATYRHWRPTVAIQHADIDGNPLTDADPSWTQRGAPLPGSPENYSGHSAFGAAGATVLAGFFCNDNISFILLSDSAAAFGLPAREYPRFSSAAAEMGRSRPDGGFHFEFSNQQGLAAGRAIASEVLATTLLRRHGQTHFGQCPL
jgi:hypothetical protein